MTSWMDTEAIRAVGQDYDKAINFIKTCFKDKNKDQIGRQVYCHATCATDTSNVAFVMDSVFDVILKENLRKMEKVDIADLIVTGGTGKSMASKTVTYANYTVALCYCTYCESLTERKVLVSKADNGKLPAVEIGPDPDLRDPGCPEWKWAMGLGKDVPVFGDTPKAELGTFNGNFKDACKLLREIVGPTLGFIYDKPIIQEAGGAKTTLIICVNKVPKSDAVIDGYCWKDFEEFENLHYKALAGVDTAANPCKPPAKGEEFNPFAANPVGFRWFKGINLYTDKALAMPDKGVYLGMLKVLSTPSGFQIMVNEHDRIMIPLIFITETQLGDEELAWFKGVRIRETKGIDLLEGKKPNLGWLGPEMSGEEGATFPEKMWWAIDEGRARLGGGQDQVSLEKFGKLFDAEPLMVDENNNIQLILFASLAQDSDECLPGHVWMDRQGLETQNMKYMCPITVSAIQGVQTEYLAKYVSVETDEGGTMEKVTAMRAEKKGLEAKIQTVLSDVGPLKWVNRVILWCADKMPSTGDDVPGCENMDAKALTTAAVDANLKLLTAMAAKRNEIIAKYKK